MKKTLLILIAIVSTGMFAMGQTPNTTVVTNLSAERFKAIIAYEKTGVLIDLRTPDEIAKGYIKGALFLDFLAKDAEARIDALDKNKTYMVYCAGGGRSGDCAAYMEKHGFKKVYNLEKGFSDWSKKAMPIESKK